ncbi:MAG: hypothetical protein M1812_005901 [Candelaria pacifica]|nr:MAG: hypothetical protein M1812_005901 [Candelaria pacifica]
MSKSQQPYEYNVTRPLHEPYAAYAPPLALHQPIAHSKAPHGQDQHEQLPYGAESHYAPREAFEQQPVPYVDDQARHLPEVVSYAPPKGSAGTKFFVHIQSIYDLGISPAPLLSLMFGSKRCNSQLTRSDRPGHYFQYTLSAHVPSFATTSWAAPEVIVYLRLGDESDQELGTVEVGGFTYTDVSQQQVFNSPQDATRKRKISPDSRDSRQSPAKRMSNQQQPKSGEDYASYGLGHGELPLYSPYLQSATTNAYNFGSGYDRLHARAEYHQHSPTRPMTYQYPSTPTVSQLPAKTHVSIKQAWSPPYSAVSQASKSPGLTMTSPATRVSTISSPSNSANPSLIRTSTLQQSPSPATTPAGAAKAGQAFNPYAMYPHKAILKINGDLDSMAENWTVEEWNSKRRLVNFTRHQGGNIIHADFKPITPEDRPPNSTCISCIWWEEKKECYVTSVDTIYLLESLVAVRFTVEEKNRIRRNLEGFRPLTVSKAKSDSEDFFKIIMAFPNPKPRNIEKDVKVFPWKILAHALKKIIGKYSASYSSTAGALLTPVSSSSGYGSGGPSEASNEQHHTASPLAGTSIPMSQSNLPAMTSTAISPRSQPPTSLQQSPVPPNLRISVPAFAASHTPPAHHWQHPQQTQQQQMHQPQLQQPMVPQAGHGSWDFTAYIETSPATATPGGAQNLEYSRGGLNINSTHESSGSHLRHINRFSGA